jgi:peptidoglycan hydrolase-like protein with peptidoglycan-binding domain
MNIPDYEQWVAAGRPWHPCAPVEFLAAACRKHGVGYGILGDHRHETADPPEDHEPFSQTPWPNRQPYPFVFAIDIYTTDVRVARRMIAAKESGRLPCLKYMNFTNEHGQVEHISWQPAEAIHASSDAGHIHGSIRTDHVACSHAAGFDPFVDTTSVPPTQSEEIDVASWVTVQKGSKGGPASIAQGLLIGHGYTIGSKNGLPDGDFGDQSEASTVRFQRARGIKDDGIFGPVTVAEALH